MDKTSFSHLGPCETVNICRQIFSAVGSIMCNGDTGAFFKQIAQLSQTDHAAGWSVSVKVEDDMVQTIYRSTFNHCDVIGLQNDRIR